MRAPAGPGFPALRDLFWGLIPALLCACMSACGANSAPVFDAIDAQIAAVGDELTIRIHASDAEGDTITFSFACEELPDLSSRMGGPTIEHFDGGYALFHWIPQADDARAEAYRFDFLASDGRSETPRSVDIKVRTQGGSGAPVFVTPTGSGTTLQLDDQPCLELPIEVQDTDSTEVTLGQEAPLIEGATLTQTGPFTGTWKWCPTPDQVQTQDRFYLRLSADDGENPKTVKLPAYLIVVIGSGKHTNCPGTGPVITQTPLPDQTTVQDLEVSFTVKDDVGLKGTPILYWSTVDPGEPPKLSAMMPIATVRKSGDGVSGGYSGTIPNPVASSPSGTQKTVYYLLVARDNDDPTGGCNHVTYAPETEASSFKVTNTGVEGGLAVCQACTSDAQCGGAADHCITIGGSLRCGAACGAGNGCPSGYTCTANSVTSVNNVSATQCIPMSGACASAASCTDDAFEQNDSLAMASTAAQGLSEMTYANLMLCPQNESLDEDWYAIPVSAEGRVQLALSSSAMNDLDLALVASDGTILDSGSSISSSETVSSCVRSDVGKIYARVYSVGASPTPSPYSLAVTKTPMACACQPDAEEPDGTGAQANPMGRPTAAMSYTGLSICPGDSDWFSTMLNAGDRLIVDLGFTMFDSNGDLDIHLYRADAVTDLFPCSPTQPGCQTTNGQGAASNEHMEYVVPAGQGGTYFVVIRGYDAADTNTYAMTARVE